MHVWVVLLSTCLVLRINHVHSADDASVSFSDPDLRKFVKELMRAALLEAEDFIGKKCGPSGSNPLCHQRTTTAPPWLPLPQTEKPKWPKQPPWPPGTNPHAPEFPTGKPAPAIGPPVPGWPKPAAEPEVSTFQPYPEVNVAKRPPFSA